MALAASQSNSVLSEIRTPIVESLKEIDIHQTSSLALCW